MSNIHMTDTQLDKDKLYERVIDTINTALKGAVFTVEGAPQASVLLPDDTYRTKPVFGDQELFFKDVRVGKSGKILFSFTPVDDAPWKQCEWDAAHLDQAIPLFASNACEKLGYANLIEKLPDLITTFIADTEKAMLDEIELEKVTAAEMHKDNPKFGRF